MDRIRKKGRPKRELFLRHGIYYARFSSTDRFSTDTSDPIEASRRLELMRHHNCPWKKIPVMKTAGIESILRGYEKEAEKENQLAAREAAIVVREKEAIKKVENLDICKLLDAALDLKKQEGKPEGTIYYFESRFKYMKNYVTTNNLTLDNFDKKAALGYIQWRLGYIPLADTKKDDGKHKNGFNNRPAHAPTVNQEIMMFRNAWRLWKDEGKAGANPWAGIKHLPESGTLDEIAKKPYTLEEIKKIFDNIPNETIKNILIFQMILGTRPGQETIGITAEMIAAGKIWSHKKKRWDDFDYSDEVKEFFKENIQDRVAGIEPRNVRKAFREACKMAEVRIGKPYDLRHSYGTESLKKFKIETVSSMLRHSEIRTTQVYAKIRSEETKKAREIMQGQILGKVTEPEVIPVSMGSEEKP